MNQTLANLTKPPSARMALTIVMINAGVPQYRGTHIGEITC